MPITALNRFGEGLLSENDEGADTGYTFGFTGTSTGITGESFTVFNASREVDVRFEVVPATGGRWNLKLKEGQFLDYEAAARLDLIVRITDDEGNSIERDAPIAINNNYEAPVFNESSYDHKIEVGTEIGATLIDITATKDALASGDLTYEIIEGNDSGLFEIDAVTGRITLAIPDEVTYATTYTLKVRATDSKGSITDKTVKITDYAIRGTDAQDALHGTTDGDTIYGYGGSDTITGGDGSDVLWGGSGVDIIYGGGATDVLSGGEGDDIIYGGDGDDVIYGNEGDDTIYGGAGRDLIKGQGGADSFVLNTDATSSADMDVIGGFSVASGDKIRVESFNGVMPKTIEAFLAAANLRAETGEFDNFGTNNTIIYKVVGGDNGESDDIALMALVYFSEDLTLDMFDLPNATANQAPTFAQDSYSVSIAQGAEAGDIITNIATTDADDDTLTYAITAGNDAGLFIVDATNGDIKLAAPDTKTDAGDHTFTITATDTAGNTDTATVTITDYAIRGTDVQDVFHGTIDGDTIYGYGGHDYLNGGDGDDTIYGGDGIDRLRGNDGDDTLYGGSGSNSLTGGDGDDTLYGGSDRDSLSGGYGNDVLYGGSGNDKLFDLRGIDLLHGGLGADLFKMSFFFDTPDDVTNIVVDFNAEEGDIIGLHGIRVSGTFQPSSVEELAAAAGLRFDTSGSKVIKGHESGENDADINDTVIYKGDTAIAVIEDFTGLTLDMIELGVSGSDDDNIIHGGDVGNRISGNAGDDTIYGGAGKDYLYGNAGDDTIYGGDGDDSIYGSAGDDIIHGEDGNDNLIGGAGADTIYGGAGIDSIRGNDGDDILYGGDGDDFLNGQGGADIFALNADDTGADLVRDFIPSDGDKIRVDAFTGAIPESVEALLAATNLRVEKGHITLPNPRADSHSDSKTTENTAIYSGDKLVMVIEDFEDDLTLDMFDLPNATPNSAPVFAQDSYSASIARGAEAGDIITNIAATDADSDTLTYSITAGNDAGLFIVDATNGDIKLAVPNQRTNPGDHTLTLTATDTAGNTDTATVTITDYAIRGADVQDVLFGTADGNAIYGYDGDDTLYGGQSDDILYGGSGDDTLYGGQNDNILYGGEGDDILEGGQNDDILYGGEGDDTLWGYQGADIFVLNTDDSGFDVVRDFNAVGGDFNGSEGDKIRMTEFVSVMPTTIESFLTAANLRVVRDHIDANGDSDYSGPNTAIFRGDKLVMVLEYFTKDLTLDMFDLPNATPNSAPEFTQDSYSADIHFRVHSTDAVVIAIDADGDAVTYAITDGNDAGLFDIDATNGNILLAVPDVQIHAATHTLTVTATDTAGNTDTATVTITDGVMRGTDGDDSITGSDESDRIYAYDGDDTIRGGDGEDVILGFGGDDTIYGGSGRDRIFASDGDDTLYGGSGRDEFFAGFGNDILYGGSENDRLYAGGGDDMLYGGTGNDGLYAHDGNDTLDGGAGRNILEGGDGADTFVLNMDSGSDKVHDFTPGEGDRIRVDDFTGAVAATIEAFLTAANLRVVKGHITLDGYKTYHRGTDSATIENTAIYRGDTLLMVLEDFEDDLTLDMFDLPNAGTNQAPTFAQDSYSVSIAQGAEVGDIITNIAAEDADGDTLTYSITAGNDKGLFIVDATNGDIKLATPDKRTGAGDRTLTIAATDTAGNTADATVTITDYAVRGTDGNDTFHGRDGADFIYGYGGNDHLYGIDGDDTLYGGAGNDYLDGMDGDDTLSGGAGDDDLDGMDGDDTLYGGDGDDYLFGENGDDTLSGGAGDDYLYGDFYKGAGDDILDGGSGDDDLWGGAGDDILDGGAGDDDLWGGAGDDILNGGSGDDDLWGGAGDDILDGGAGDDDLWGGAGDDILDGGAGDDDLWGGGGDDILDGGAGNDDVRGGNDDGTLYGGAGNDRLNGEGGDDTLYGGDGKDYLRGGDDADIFVLGSENDTVVDFTPSDGDKIRVDDFSGAMPTTFEAFLTAANLRVEKGHIKVEGFNSGRDSTATENTAIYRGDTLLMVLEDFTDDLTLDMFDLPNATANNAPTFAQDSYSATLAETAEAGSAVVAVQASDVDAGDTLTYSITDGDGLFAINEDGEITLTGALDYETATTHTFTIQVEDEAGFTDTAEVTINVENANEAPIFSQDSYILELRENVGVLFVNSPWALDVDAGDVLTYSIIDGNEDGQFAIHTYALPTINEDFDVVLSDNTITLPLDTLDFDNIRGYGIALTSTLDYETATSHTFTIQVEDEAGLTDTAEVTINVENANEAPEFAQESYTAHIQFRDDVVQFGASGTAVVVSATDADGDALTYAITAGNDAGLFDIDGEGNITFGAPDVRTNPATHTLTVTATDTAGNSDTATVTITDGAIRGTDGGEAITGGESNDLIYSNDGDDILHGNDGIDTLDGGAGDDTLYGGSGRDWLYGREGDDILHGNDGNDVLLGEVGDDMLYGGSGDDLVMGYNGDDTLYGGAGADRLVGMHGADIFVLGSDVDRVIDFTPSAGDKIRVAEFTGAIPGSIDAFLTAANLRVEKGDINVPSNGFDRDNDDADIENTAIYQGDTLLMVLEDFTDDLTLDMFDLPNATPNSAPEFAQDSYSAELSEKADAGSAVVTVAARDANAGDALTYSIIDGGGLFTIDANSGEITLTGALDYETATSHTITIQVEDGAGATDTAEVIISVADTNEAPTLAQNSYTATIAQGAEIGDIITNIAAEDAEGDTITYSITAGNDSGLFIVDITNGDIKLAVPDTKTDAGDHTLTITATDTAGNSDTAIVIITDEAIRGTDGDDVITLSNAEDAPNAYIYGYGGADTIRGDGGTYILDGGDDDDTIYGSDGEFDILKGGDGDDTLYGRGGSDIIRGGRGNDTLNGGDGADFLSGSLDDDTLNGGDGGDLLVGGYGADIFVLNTTDSGADIIAEFTPSDGDKIRMEEFDGVMPRGIDAFLTAANLRVEKGHISAKWQDQTLFTDNATTENTAIYKGDALVMVLVDFTDDLTLDMFDLPNATANSAPEFAQDSYTATLAENAEAGSAVIVVQATDANAGDTLTYSIVSNNIPGLFVEDTIIDNSPPFAIDAKSGEITLTGALDFEVATTHTFTIQVEDSAGLTDTAEVTINVTDAPVFDKATHKVEIPELTEIGTVLTTVTARDPDTSGVRYSILGGRNANLFAINENTGAITLKGFLDFETAESHRLVVQASDDVSTDTINVIIGVVDEMDCACLDIAANTDEIAAGTVLTASITHDDPNGYEGGKAPESGWVWFYQSKPDQEIGDGSATYTVREQDSGEQICVRITYMDGNGRPEIVQARLEDVVQRVVIKPDAADADKDKTYTAEADKATKVEAGTGADHVRDGNRNDVIDGGKGDDEIDLSASKEDNDVVIYGIGNQMASDGADSITSFVRGRDKFVFQLKQSDIDAGNIDLSQDDGYEGFINYVTKGTEDLIDDQFWVNFNFSIGENGVQMDGISFHFKDSTFFSGGRISMPIVSIEFADPLSVDEVREAYSGRDKSTPLVKQGLLSDFDYLDDFLGGDGAVGFEII